MREWQLEMARDDNCTIPLLSWKSPHRTSYSVLYGKQIDLSSYSIYYTTMLQDPEYLENTLLYPQRNTKLDTSSPSVRIGVQTIKRKYAEASWQRLLASDGSWDGGTCQDQRCEKGKLNTVGLSVLDAVAAEEILD